jgi:hypothetical protein
MIRSELTLGIQNFQQNLQRATQDVRTRSTEMRKEMASIGTAGAGGGGLGGAFGGIAAQLLPMVGVATVMHQIKDSLTFADDIADLTLKLNDNAESLQRVDFAARQTASIGVDKVADSMLKLERSLGDVENRKAAEALQNLGISVQSLQSMSLDEKMIALSAAFQKARADGTGLYDIQTLLGRAAGDLVPMLEQGEDALRGLFERAPVQAQEAIDRMAELNDRLDEMTDKAKNVFVGSVDDLTRLAGFFKDLSGLEDGAGGLLASVMDPVSAYEAAINRQIDQENASIQARLDRDDARETAATAQEGQRERLASDAAEQAQLDAADKAEAEIVKRREQAEKARADQTERDAARVDAARFAVLDPEQQMRELQARMVSQIGGASSGSREGILAAAESLRGEGRDGEAADVFERLGKMDAIAQRMGMGEAPARAGSGERGSFATLMDEIFGRGGPEQQLAETREIARQARETKGVLDKILVKMDEPPPRDVFTDFGG